MKKNLAIALGIVLAGTAVATVATALPTSLKKPSGITSTPGVKLTGVTVQASCGKASTVNVTLSYENLKAPVKAVLWGTINQTVEVPTGTGSKTYSFAGATLSCEASGGNWDAVMHHNILLGDNAVGLETITYTATGTSFTNGG